MSIEAKYNKTEEEIWLEEITSINSLAETLEQKIKVLNNTSDFLFIEESEEFKDMAKKLKAILTSFQKDRLKIHLADFIERLLDRVYTKGRKLETTIALFGRLIEFFSEDKKITDKEELGRIIYAIIETTIEITNNMTQGVAHNG